MSQQPHASSSTSHTAVVSFASGTLPTAGDHHAAVTAIEGEDLYQLIKRSDVNPHEVEVVGAHAVEVSILWRSSILHVAHLDGSRDFVLTTQAAPRAPAGRALMSGLAAGGGLIAAGAAMGNYVVGALGTVVALAGAGAGIALDQQNAQARRDTSRFLVDSALVEGASEAPVVLNSGGTTRFVFLPGATGEVEFDGTKRSFEQLIVDGVCRPSGALAGAHEIEMKPGVRYRMEFGGLSVLGRVVAPGRRIAGGGRRDPARLWAGLGAAGAVAAIVGAALFASSADDGVMAQGNDEDRLAELRAFVTRQQERSPEPVPQSNQGAAPASTPGQAHAGPNGLSGSRTAPMRDARLTVADRHRATSLGATAARAAVAVRGAFGGLTSMEAYAGPNSPFEGLLASGADSEDHNGHVTGAVGGDAAGYGGLGTLSTGIGGGGDGVGTIGTGPFGRIGDSDRARIAGTRPLGLPGRPPRGPIVEVLPPQTSGGLPADAIRRVVLRNLAQVQHCHTEGLSQNPALAGRVVVRFVIGSGGNVMGSEVASSSLSVPSVSTCIAQAVRRWQFPSPSDGGTATVSYPFSLQPPQ